MNYDPIVKAIMDFVDTGCTPVRLYLSEEKYKELHKELEDLYEKRMLDEKMSKKKFWWHLPVGDLLVMPSPLSKYLCCDGFITNLSDNLALEEMSEPFCNDHMEPFYLVKINF